MLDYVLHVTGFVDGLKDQGCHSRSTTVCLAPGQAEFTLTGLERFSGKKVEIIVVEVPEGAEDRERMTELQELIASHRQR